MGVMKRCCWIILISYSLNNVRRGKMRGKRMGAQKWNRFTTFCKTYIIYIPLQKRFRPFNSSRSLLRQLVQNRQLIMSKPLRVYRCDNKTIYNFSSGRESKTMHNYISDRLLERSSLAPQAYSRLFQSGTRTISVAAVKVQDTLYCSIYVSPRPILSLLLEALHFIIEKDYRYVVIAGDFNIDFNVESSLRSNIL